MTEIAVCKKCGIEIRRDTDLKGTHFAIVDGELLHLGCASEQEKHAPMYSVFCLPIDIHA